MTGPATINTTSGSPPAATSRTATAQMMNIAGAEIPGEIVVPHVMRQVTEADCDPDQVTPTVSGRRSSPTRCSP